MTIARSPYEVAIGGGLEGLHPRLAAYFSAIPDGSIGRGHGVFDVVGTPRRWLWPVLWLLGRQGVVFAVWRHDVPFTVENRRAVDASGVVAVDAVRTFHFGSGSDRARPGDGGARGVRHMIDAITAEHDGLVDHLGTRRQWSAELTAEVVGGELHLTSTRMWLAIAGRRVPLPRPLSPVVRLTERFDDDADRQRVRITLDLPAVGRIYEYSGSFRYTIEPLDPASASSHTRPPTPPPTTGADT
ncbi:DUF4166 domain-containing protein [Frigoribacterium sp. 2-23]|uniref:DUF4166 domain-containing protein n=1 Tax=Frigoribacterium sp. 2-23 TaxID=3415006 RepID=UPI003C6FC972